MKSRCYSLTIAFESKCLTYSDSVVDLYNSGLNQILSVAASRGHTLYHFNMASLFLGEGHASARVSVLSLPDLISGDPLNSYLSLQKIDERNVLLKDIDLCFFRADDVSHAGTPNLNIIAAIEEHGTLMESVKATLNTNDKYEIVVRVPQVPQPVTYAASSLADAIHALQNLPGKTDYFVLKDRFGYGCGQGVHRLSFADAELTQKLSSYLDRYHNIIIQDYCSEVRQGDLVVTFFDGELIGSMRREASQGEWKTNYSLGATHHPYNLNTQQEQIARTVQNCFQECRFLSVDMLQSGKVLEVNAFPGGKGLLDLYGISVGNIVMNKLECELLEKIDNTSPEIKLTPPLYYLFNRCEESLDKLGMPDIQPENV